MSLDHKLTSRIADWLNLAPADRDIMAGATMLLSLNRNRAMFNTITRKPEKYASKLEYELRKHLNIRVHNVSVSDLRKVEAEVMSVITETVETMAVISSDDELPVGIIALGRREDHDSLPPQVQALWDDNGERYRRIVLLFNELKAMHDVPACDRLEKILMLGDLDKRYRESLRMYDSYDRETHVGQLTLEARAKAINAARKTVSKYKKVLTDTEPDDEQRTTAINKIVAAVGILHNNEAVIDQANINELIAAGVPADTF